MSFALSTAESITEAIDEIIRDVCPTAGSRPMYGGMIFERELGNHGTSVCGHFIYKQHVSLEFSNGAELKDPDSILEGKGKYRRHIKLRDLADIEEKNVREFLRQAFLDQA
ncbi:MAG: DUF1801 domain-containing protein [Pseudomonadota bacterium]